MRNDWKRAVDAATAVAVAAAVAATATAWLPGQRPACQSEPAERQSQAAEAAG